MKFLSNMSKIIIAVCFFSTPVGVNAAMKKPKTPADIKISELLDEKIIGPGGLFEKQGEEIEKLGKLIQSYADDLAKNAPKLKLDASVKEAGVPGTNVRKASGYAKAIMARGALGVMLANINDDAVQTVNDAKNVVINKIIEIEG